MLGDCALKMGQLCGEGKQEAVGVLLGTPPSLSLSVQLSPRDPLLLILHLQV
jgi:hypothetical protein